MTFSPVCPPSPAMTPSGFSFTMTSAMASVVMGSMYTASAISGSVMMVAGFELTSTTRTPSSCSARHACAPE